MEILYCTSKVVLVLLLIIHLQAASYFLYSSTIFWIIILTTFSSNFFGVLLCSVELETSWFWASSKKNSIKTFLVLIRFSDFALLSGMLVLSFWNSLCVLRTVGTGGRPTMIERGVKKFSKTVDTLEFSPRFYLMRLRFLKSVFQSSLVPERVSV